MHEVSPPSLLPLWEKVSPKATDAGCSRERQRLTPLEHPSSVSALTRRSTFSHRGRRERRAMRYASSSERLIATPYSAAESSIVCHRLSANVANTRTLNTANPSRSSPRQSVTLV